MTIVTDRHRAVWQPSGVPDFTARMAKMGIKHIFAMGPQSKGRVERMNRTLQDRLVKYLHENRVANIAQANAALPHFIELYNLRFKKSATDPRDSHLKLRATLDASKHIELRKVSRNLTVSVNGRIYLLPNEPRTRFLVGQRIEIRFSDDSVIGVLQNGEIISLCNVD